MRLLKAIMYFEAGSIITWAWMMGHLYTMTWVTFCILPFVAMDLVAVITPWDLKIFRPFIDFDDTEKAADDTDQSNHQAA